MAPSDDHSNIDYYDELAGEYSLFFHDLAQNMEEEGDWLDAIMRTHHVHRVLDASCGTGRQAIPLRERGYDVVAADPSAPMLAGADREATQHGVRIPLVKAGFGDLPAHFDSEFDAVVALGNGLCNQVVLRAIEESLRNLRRCSRPSGICLVGIKDFDSIRESFERFHAHKVADDGMQRTILFEVWDMCEPHLLCTSYIIQGPFDPNSPQKSEWITRARTTREFMLSADELSRVARRAGFRSVQRLDRASEATFLLLP